MAVSRYTGAPILDYGKMYGTTQIISVLRSKIDDGSVSIDRTFTTNGFERLDTLAGVLYGEGRYWWLLAAASDIGWGLQVPPGTVIKVPNLESSLSFIK